MKNKKVITNKSGMAMLSVILFFLVLVILLAGVMNSSVTNLNSTQTVKENTAVYYAAETGINKQAAALQALVEDTLAGLNGRTAENFETNLAVEIANINNATNFTNSLGATIDIGVTGTAPSYTLRSVATNDGVTRILESNFSYVLGNEDVGQAIVTEGGFTSANNNSDFTFPISALLLNNTTLDIRNCGTGDPNDGNKRIVYVPTAEAATRVNTNGLVCSPGITTSINPNLPGWNSTPKGFATFTMPTYPAYTGPVIATPSAATSTMDLSGAANTYYVDTLQMSSVTTLTINLGNKGVNNITTLIVNPSKTLTTMNANINVTGQGKLKVYVKLNTTSSGTTWNGNVVNPEGNPTKFQLYAYNTSSTIRPLTFSNNLNFIGSILNQKNRFVMANGNFQGYIMSGCSDNGSTNLCFSVSSNTGLGNSQGIWIYVPDGTISLSSNAYILGSAIANKVIMGGSNKITEITYQGISQDVPFTEIVDLPLPTIKVLKSATFGNVVEK